MKKTKLPALKPCPFCGSEAFLLTNDADPNYMRYYIMCANAECGLFGSFESEKEAVKAWNSRATRNNSGFFRNTECEYYPCHRNADKDNFNCLFCYCPLYHMKKCPGNPELFNGIKDCTNCTLPHTDYDAVISVLMEFFLNKVGMTMKYKEEAQS